MSQINVGDHVSWDIRPGYSPYRKYGRVMAIYPLGNGVYEGEQHAFMTVRTLTDDWWCRTLDYSVPLHNKSIELERGYYE